MTFLRVVATLVLLAVFGWGLAILSVFIFGQRDEARAADAVVVLGAAQYDGRPSPVLKARLDHAIELHAAGFADHMIMTGGVGVGDTVSEAEVGKRYAVKAGVEQQKILVERTGMSSEASMRAVAALMRENQLESAILVSDPFHMLRLRLLARRLGFEARSSPTTSSPIDPHTTEGWRHVLRESIILPTLIIGRTPGDLRIDG